VPLDDPYIESAFSPRRRPTAPSTIFAAIALAVITLVAGGAYLWSEVADGAARGRPGSATGIFVLSSHPSGATVVVDGEAAGVTPLALNLTSGPHEVVVTSPLGVSERLTAEVPTGETASRHVALESPAAQTAQTTPAAPTAAAPDAAPAAAASAPAAAPRAPRPPPVAAGSVSFSLPFDVQVYEGGRFIGTNQGERIRVTPGRHTFNLVNEQLGFRTTETVVVAPGRNIQRVVDPRTATLSVNAQPWAEVYIAGRSYGETPLANISLPLGVHQVTLVHPSLGQRVVPVTIRLGAPNRLSLDLRR
jgi:hypothetical protein